MTTIGTMKDRERRAVAVLRALRINPFSADLFRPGWRCNWCFSWAAQVCYLKHRKGCLAPEMFAILDDRKWADAMTPEERTERARKAGLARAKKAKGKKKVGKS